MSEDLEKKLLKGVAYRMFFDELQKHTAAAQGFFASGTWTAEGLKEMSGRFHTIRGSAGFFKLVEVAALAGELEKGLVAGSVSDVVANQSHLQEIFKQLQEASLRLPQPVTPPVS